VSLRLITGSATDVGRVRTGNEDAYLVDEGIGLIAVADGMGGHQAGEVASSTALEALRAAVTGGDAIRDAIVHANDAVWEKSGADERLRGMGTTLTAGTPAAGDTLVIGHVGDSRAYLARNGSLERITVDHSVVAELVQAGELTEEQAELDPRRSMITRALGVEPGIDVDVITLELVPGDRVLLCSDGLTSMVREDDIGAILAREVDPTRAAHALIDAANDNGGADNITAVVVDVVEAGGDSDVPALVDAAPARNVAGDPPAAPAAPNDDTAPMARHDSTVVIAAPLAHDKARGLRLPPEPSTGIVTEHEDIVRAELRADRRAQRRARTRTAWRITRWVLPVVLIVGLAIGAVAWYARNRYYVGLEHARVTVFRGVPGGLLVWDPTIESRTRLTASELTSAQRDDVRGNKTFSSRDDANAYVNELRAGVRHRASSSTTTTTTTATTTTTTPANGATTTPGAPGATG
jgi:protein phosphatase